MRREVCEVSKCIAYLSGFLGTGAYLFLAFSWYCLAFLPVFLLLHFRRKRVRFGKIAIEVLVLLMGLIYAYVCLTGSFLNGRVVTLLECVAKRPTNYALFTVLAFAITVLTARIIERGVVFTHVDPT